MGLKKMTNKGKIISVETTLLEIGIILCVWYRMIVLYSGNVNYGAALWGFFGKYAILFWVYGLFLWTRKKDVYLNNLLNDVVIGIGVATVISWCGFKTCVALIPMFIIMIYDLWRKKFKLKELWVILFSNGCLLEIYSIFMLAYYYEPTNIVNNFVCSKWSDLYFLVIVMIGVLDRRILTSFKKKS